ncbi:hypothetical protein PMAC_002680 [Pneumocystis sp. 'macacae']|nr:hypothetical protein PMAC_002680 [Pneumocystis sp. 'macacae']
MEVQMCRSTGGKETGMKENRSPKQGLQRRAGERRPLWVLSGETVVGGQVKEGPRCVYVASEGVGGAGSVFSCMYATEGFVTPSREAEGKMGGREGGEKNTGTAPQSAPAKANQCLFKEFDIYCDDEVYVEMPKEAGMEVFSLEMNKENVSPVKSKWISQEKKYRL